MPRCHKLLAVLVVLASPPCWAEEILPAGRRLAQKLDAMDVEHLWLSGQSVNWKTGEPFAESKPSKGRHTHCSAFAAEACRRLGIYLLHPPEHSTVLLSNAQYDWLFLHIRQGTRLDAIARWPSGSTLCQRRLSCCGRIQGKRSQSSGPYCDCPPEHEKQREDRGRRSPDHSGGTPERPQHKFARGVQTPSGRLGKTAHPLLCPQS